MIPKKIHYCWLGGGEKPKLAEKCIKSWKKYCPDYEIIEWNESNLDISSFPLYTRQAYEAKKWGFVPDYIRLWLVYNHGGLYLDTDVELMKSPDDLLGHPSFFGFEDSGFINLGQGFGAEANNTIIKEMMDDYLDRSFINEDGSLDTTPSPAINTEIFLRHGLVKNNTYQIIEDKAVVFPTEYFCPLGYYTGELSATDNTYSIHHYMASWQTDEEREIHNKRLKDNKKKAKKDDFRLISEEKGFVYACIYMIRHFRDY